MAWRKWIVRGIVWGIVGAAAAGALAYQRWTNPGAVREQVIDAIAKTFPGVHVSVDSARLRLFGGIQLAGLRITRADDPEKREVLHVPTAIFYHDKEKILDGELKLRKIELFQPRLRVRRKRDGTWNVQDLLPRPKGLPLAYLPAIVIHHGAVILEDRADPAKRVTLEVNDAALTLINDSLPRIAIRGAAKSDLLGKLYFHGRADRERGDIVVSFRATQIPLTPALLAKLPLPPEVLLGLQVSAQANIEGKIAYDPRQPIFYDVRGEVSDGRVQHPRLPLPLEGLRFKIHCNAGTVQVEGLTARSGRTEISGRGIAQLRSLEDEFEAHVDLKHVILGDDLASRLPPKLLELHKLFQPNGPTAIHIACAKHAGEWATLASGAPSTVSLRPERIALTFKGFPYPLERAEGDIDYNLLNKHVQVNLVARADGQDVLMHGHWTGEGPQADVQFDIETKGKQGVSIDERLMNALPKGLKEFAESFHANGKIDVKAHLSQKPGNGFQNEFHVKIKDAAIQWDDFRYPLEKVSGYLDIYPKHWEFHDFQGTRAGGHVLLNGKSIPRTDDNNEKTFGVSFEITGRDIPLDDVLHEALRTIPTLHKSWETFRPSGKLFFTAAVERPSADLKDLEVHVDARGVSAKPTFFPYRVQDIHGQFRFHKMRLAIHKLRARHEQALLALDRGAVDIDPRGGYHAQFDDLQWQGLRIDKEFIDALPSKLQGAATALKLEDPLRVKTKIVIAQPPETGKPPDVYWDGQAWLYAAKLTTGLEFSNVTGTIACIGRYDGRQIVGVDGNLLLEHATLYNQPFKNVHAKFQMREQTPDVLLVGLRAPIFGGDVTGQVRVDFSSAQRYEMNLTASQINLAEFGRHNLGPKSQLAGAANARMHLTGLGTGIDSLDGNGAIDIDRGHLYNLPFLLDLLKFLGLHWPDRTAFEEFHAGFSVQGSRIHVRRLDLLGSAVSLAGKGDFDLASKKIDLDVYPMWGRVEQLLPPVVRPFPTTLSKNLLTVEVRGKVSDDPKELRFRMKPMPIIVDPLLLLRDRVIGQPGAGEFEPPPAPRDRERPRPFRLW